MKTKEHEETLPAKIDAPKTGSAVAVVDMGDDVGVGLENVGRGEVRIPLVRILQPLSPQCKPPSNGGLQGARPGMFFNTGTTLMYDGEVGLDFVPCWRDHNFVEYIPRDNGGGFVGIHAPGADIVELLRAVHGPFGRLPVLSVADYEKLAKEKHKAKKLGVVNLGGAPIVRGSEMVAHYAELAHAPGTEIVESYYLYVIMSTPDGMIDRVVFPYQSTQIKPYQGFISQNLAIKYPDNDGTLKQPAIYLHKWHAGSVFQKNKKGEFYGWTLRLAATPSREAIIKIKEPELFKEAKEFANLIKTGGAKADVEADARQGGDGEGSANGQAFDDEIPF